MPTQRWYFVNIDLQILWFCTQRWKSQHAFLIIQFCRPSPSSTWSTGLTGCWCQTPRSSWVQIALLRIRSRLSLFCTFCPPHPSVADVASVLVVTWCKDCICLQRKAVELIHIITMCLDLNSIIIYQVIILIFNIAIIIITIIIGLGAGDLYMLPPPTGQCCQIKMPTQPRLILEWTVLSLFSNSCPRKVNLTANPVMANRY